MSKSDIGKVINQSDDFESIRPSIISELLEEIDRLYRIHPTDSMMNIERMKMDDGSVYSIYMRDYEVELEEALSGNTNRQLNSDLLLDMARILLDKIRESIPVGSAIIFRQRPYFEYGMLNFVLRTRIGSFYNARLINI
jgi:hypothetical protein